MKNNLLRKALVFGVMMLFLGASVTPIITRNASADDTNLLTNPGFESGLSGWGDTHDSATWTITSDSHSGSYAVKGVEIYQGNLGRLYQDFTGRLIPGTQYKIGGWIKTENVQGVVVIALDYVTGGGWCPADGYVKEIGYVSGTTGWSYYENDWFTLPPMPADCEMLWFLFDFNAGKGTAYWDDVFLLGELLSLPDLTVSEVKPVQVVYDPDINDDGRIDLVLGKATAVLATIEIENSELLYGSTEVDIRLSLDGEEIETITKTVDQLENNGQVEFYFTLSNIGDYDVVVKVDPKDEIEESNETNNVVDETVTVKDTRGLHVAYIPVVKPGSYGPLVEYLDMTEASGIFIRGAYPVAESEYVNESRVEEYEGHDSHWPHIIPILRDMHGVYAMGQRLTNGRADYVVGVVSWNYFIYHSYDGGTIGLAHWSTDGVLAVEGWWTTVAHEVGHKFGLPVNPVPPWWNPFVNEEYNNTYDGHPTFGYWADRALMETAHTFDRNVPTSEFTATCFMGTAVYHDLTTRWIDDDDFEHLFEESLIQRDDPDVLLLSGLVYKNGTVELGKSYWFEDGTSSYFYLGNDSIQILDFNGSVIEQINFSVPFMVYVEPKGIEEINVSSFAFKIPFPTNGSKIIITINQTVTEVNPNTNLLHDAVDSIPDYGFIRNPGHRRKALHNKINEIEIKIEENNITDARNKLEFDIKDKLEKWLVDYEVENPSQLTKDEIIPLVDEIIYRLSMQT